VVRDPHTKNQIAGQTIYGRTIQDAPVIIAVFSYKSAMYDEVKDHMAIGACIQNMLLAVCAHNLGAVWLGEILKNREKVREILQLSKELELMAVVAVGHPARRDQRSDRKDIRELILKEI
jgi:nitroreductase